MMPLIVMLEQKLIQINGELFSGLNVHNLSGIDTEKWVYHDGIFSS